MKKFKPNLIECAIVLLFFPYGILFLAIIIFSIISFAYRGIINLNLIPWQVYLSVGIIFVLPFVFYLIYLFAYKNIIFIDEKHITYFKKKNKCWEFEKTQIDKIEYTCYPWFLCWAYDDYGTITIFCNEECNYVKKKFKVFRHTKKLIEKELAIKIINIK